MLAYWSSSSGNTAAFIEAAAIPAYRIPNGGGVMDSPFILVMPTFADGHGRGGVPKPIKTFLNDPQNRGLLKGVIGAGNRNFGENFCIGARIVAEKCHVPLLYRFELRGTPRDIANVKAGTARFLHTNP